MCLMGLRNNKGRGHWTDEQREVENEAREVHIGPYGSLQKFGL